MFDGGTAKLRELGEKRACGTFALEGTNETRLSGSVSVAVE